MEGGVYFIVEGVGGSIGLVLEGGFEFSCGYVVVGMFRGY